MEFAEREAHMRSIKAGLLVALLAFVLAATGVWLDRRQANAAGQYIILGWNDLGMHCYNNDFKDMAVLPPYNTLWVQVLKKGDPPELVMSGITVSYSFEKNTTSVGKTNFWEYDQALFGVDLPPDVGLKGKGMKGTMDPATDHFIAEGIPITEFNDGSRMSQPYQIADIVVTDNTTGAVLATQRVVTPVSSEMRCDTCHKDGGSANPTIRTRAVATNILTLHDKNEGTSLMSQRPVLCANCHGSNALGAAGQPGVPNLSNAMHGKHTGVVKDSLTGCYNCHPGPKTKCLRDVMSKEGMTCINCHGGMSQVSKNTDPWLNEPRCDSCHKEATQNHPLYRFSTGHGNLYCAACHDSPHAVAPSRNSRDGLKFIALQGSNGPLEKCTVCHSTEPSGSGPHGGGGGD
jgi:hypothetical protein